MPYPKVFLDKKNRTAPLVVRDAQEEAALDPAEWVADPPSRAPTSGAYPKMMFNVNVPPIVVFSPEQEDALGPGHQWRQLPIVLPNDPPVKLDPESASINQTGGSGTFTVTMIGAGKSNVWTATKDASLDWVTFSPTTPQGQDGTVNYTVSTNISPASAGRAVVPGPPRTGYIYINGETFTIDQDGK